MAKNWTKYTVVHNIAKPRNGLDSDRSKPFSCRNVPNPSHPRLDTTSRSLDP